MNAPLGSTPIDESSFGSSGIRWSQLLPTAALVVTAVIALQFATNRNRTLAVESAGETIAAPRPATGLGLKVSSQLHQLDIRWDHGSAAIAACEQGVMRITEGDTTEALSFDQDQLRDGYVAYTPKTNDVSIRLEVIGKDGATKSEFVRAVATP